MKKLRMCLYLMFMFYALAIASAILCTVAFICDFKPLVVLTAGAVLAFGMGGIGALCGLYELFVVYDPEKPK